MTRKLSAGTSLAVFSSLMLSGAAFAAGPFGGGDGRGMGRDGRHPFLLICGIVLVGGLAALITWLIMRGRRSTHPVAAAPGAAPEAILAERLARSEISVEDYRAALAALRELSPAS